MILAGVLAALTLFEQTVERRVQALRMPPDLSYLIVSARSGDRIATNWEAPERPVAVGSLVKPFTALAVLRNEPNPVVECRPGACWLPKGHGRMDLPSALAHSCNAFFVRISTDLSKEIVPLSAKTLTGFGREWPQSPAGLAEAYRQLRNELNAAPVLEGMRRAVTEGTARGIGRTDAWAKTGTAPCSHGKGAGDGFVVVMTREVVLLVRVHGTTGSRAAERARPIVEMLR